MDNPIPNPSSAAVQSSASPGAKRKRGTEPKFYSVRLGHKPGIYHSWPECLKQVKGFKKATFKSFSTLTDAERFLAGEEVKPDVNGVVSPSGKYYAVKNGRVPGIYTDWASAQVQITGWTKPKHRCFSTRAEAQRFLDEDDEKDKQQLMNQLSPVIFQQPPSSDFGSLLSEVYSGGNYITPSPASSKKRKTEPTNGVDKTLKSQPMPDFSEADFDPGTAPLPPGTEDGFDPNIILDPTTGQIVYKTLEQRQATRIRPVPPAQTAALRIYTDGSSLGNGTGGANAGVGIYFGPGDVRNASEPLPPTSRQTNQRAELTAILRALEISPRNRAITIVTDSKYAIDCCTSWYVTWRKNGWKTAGGKSVENKDLVENILGKVEERKLLGAETGWEWVKGHEGDRGNVEADRLAVQAARGAQAASSAAAAAATTVGGGKMMRVGGGPGVHGGMG